MAETKPAAAPEELTKENVIRLYREKIPAALYSFYADFLPENLKDDRTELDRFITENSQNRFTAGLMYVCKAVFQNRKLLKLQAYKHSMPGYENSMSYEYDIDIITAILDIYIYLCHRYDKDVSIYGFCSLTGINQDTIYRWYRDYKNNPYGGNGGFSVSGKQYEIYKKLTESRQESMTGMLLTGRKNPVGILAALNHLYGWADTGRPADTTTPAALPAASLPNFDRLKSIDLPGLPDNSGPDT